MRQAFWLQTQFDVELQTNHQQVYNAAEIGNNICKTRGKMIHKRTVKCNFDDDF